MKRKRAYGRRLGWMSPTFYAVDGGPLRFAPLTAPLRGPPPSPPKRVFVERQTPIAAG